MRTLRHVATLVVLTAALVCGARAACAFTCQSDDECNRFDPCLTDRCDPNDASAGLDGCVHAPVADGSSCDDGNPCTTSDVGSLGPCEGEVQPDGTPCDDGNSCTADDTCSDGTCTAVLLDGEPCDDGN